LVMPAIGASTTAGSTSSSPSRNEGSADVPTSSRSSVLVTFPMYGGPDPWLVALNRVRLSATNHRQAVAGASGMRPTWVRYSTMFQ
jgi:hypothetical protein